MWGELVAVPIFRSCTTLPRAASPAMTSLRLLAVLNVGFKLP